MLFDSFQAFVEKNELISENTSTLLAISGGIDSVVLAHLLAQSGYSFACAHINFQLRGEESDGDAAFCKQLAKELNVPYYYTKVDTLSLAKEKGQSIQLVARDFRYDWLRKTAQKQGFSQIATAHHLNDNLETLIFNQTKGCGLKGLQGIPLRNEEVIRPILFASRRQIEAFALENQLHWREDASNASLKYNRNLIRHEVIPALKQINPSVEETTANNLRRWQESYQLYKRMVLQLKNQIVQEGQEVIRIDAKELANYPERATLLFEWLSPYGFTEFKIRDLLDGEGSGRQFLSTSHRLVTHQDLYLVERLQAPVDTEIKILADQSEVDLGEGQLLQLRLLNNPPDFFQKDAHIAYVSEQQLHFPLVLRRWRTGDRFQPFGMKGQHQKLQDFFSNHKLSLVEKEKVWVLTSAGKICWVVGMRMDERFRVQEGEGCWELRFTSQP